MRVEKKKIGETRSCNFCNKGVLNEAGNNLIYPYEMVFEFSRDDNSGLLAVICEDCLKELQHKSTNLLTPQTR